MPLTLFITDNDECFCLSFLFAIEVFGCSKILERRRRRRRRRRPPSLLFSLSCSLEPRLKLFFRKSSPCFCCSLQLLRDYDDDEAASASKSSPPLKSKQCSLSSSSPPPTSDWRAAGRVVHKSAV